MELEKNHLVPSPHAKTETISIEGSKKCSPNRRKPPEKGNDHEHSLLKMWRARIDPSRPLPLQFCQRSLAPSSSIHKHRSLGLDCFQADSPNVLLMDTTTSNWKLSEPVPLDLLVPMDLKDRNLSPQELISKSIAAMREWIAAQPQKSPKSKSTRRPPPPPICDCLATTTLCYTDWPGSSTEVQLPRTMSPLPSWLRL